MSDYDDDDRSIFFARRSDKTIVSRSFSDNLTGQRLRIISKVVDGQEGLSFARVDDERVLRITPTGRYAIKATVLEDDRKIKTLTIQKYRAPWLPMSEPLFSFVGPEIDSFIEFVAGIKTIPLAGRDKQHVTDNQLRDIVLSRSQIFKLLSQNEDILAEFVQNTEFKRDLVAVGYRRKQLERFASLLNRQSNKGAVTETVSESDWQAFFEANTWIFGYGLSYQFLTRLDDKKLEQLVCGADVAGQGKRVDALMKTRGRLSSLCFVEIKRHDSPLLQSKPYRSSAWGPSSELSGSISQVQATVHSAVENIGRRLDPTNAQGTPTGESIFNFEPRSFLVIGNLSEFVERQGINEQRLRSFELFRRSIRWPQIITFDELLERARFIAELSDESG